MTREEEDRRLALSTAIARVNAAIDSLDQIDGSAFGVRSLINDAIVPMRSIVSVAQADLDALKKMAIDEEREATK